MPLPENLDPAAVQQEFADAQSQMIAAFHRLPLNKQQATVHTGEALFFQFLAFWLQGLDPETFAPLPDTDQPDRAELLKELQRGATSFRVLMYILSTGNLQCACLKHTRGNKDRALRLAGSIQMPASLLFADLAYTFSVCDDPFSTLQQDARQ